MGNGEGGEDSYSQLLLNFAVNIMFIIFIMNINKSGYKLSILLSLSSIELGAVTSARTIT